MRILIAGTGYVGLVTGACLARIGHDVVCIDTDEAKILALTAGVVPIYEPGLEDIVDSCTRSGRLSFATSLPPIDGSVDVVFIAVGTPPAEDGNADLSAVFGLASQIAAATVGKVVVAIKSTVPPGTGERVEAHIRALRPDISVSVVSNPEFLREGSAVQDFMEPDRIVVGAEDPDAGCVVAEVYEPIASTGVPLLTCGRKAAELSKYAANAFLATKIAFINEMADLCESMGADVEEVAEGMGSDHRIGRAFLAAGPGYGGSCFPKDTEALLSVGRASSVRMRVVEAAMSANASRKRGLWRRVEQAVGGDLFGRRIAVLGLAFKAGTDDMRESSAIDLIEGLAAAGALVVATDPKAGDNAGALLPGLVLHSDPYACIAGSDCVVLVTDWPEFERLDCKKMAGLVLSPVFVDLRNRADASRLGEAGFVVHRIGQAAPHDPRPSPMQPPAPRFEDAGLAVPAE